MDTIFTVKNDNLERFSPEQAVAFFRELLWAEATALGIGKNLVNVPSAITVADGGIDAEVQDVQGSGGQGIIKQGLTRYQIKTGNFSPSNDADVKSILFKDGSSGLRPRVKSCLDKHGTLVVVLFGWDNPEKEDDQYIQKFKEKLVKIDKEYSSAFIEIWPQNKLIGFLKPFPSLALQATGRGDPRFQTHRSWSQDAEMKRELRLGQPQKELILGMQEELRKNGEAAHVRIYGEPGIGKTRLVLEATREADLQALVVYCFAAGFRDSELMNEILREDNQFYVILVVDECDKDNRSYIWDKLKYRGPRIKLVSIYSEYDDTGGNISYFDTPPLNKDDIGNIIQAYGIQKEQADRWSELCGGSPRVAHVIGSNLVNNPDDLLKSPDTVNIWERYIVGGDDPDSQNVQQRRLVLRYLALFKRFGYGPPVIAEAKAIVKLIEQTNPQITLGRFQEIIRNLKDRKILQGENTLYITPKALHIYLWSDWWDTYGTGFNFEEFSRDFSGPLSNWFYEMFKYAAESQAASRVVKDLLGEVGPFQNDTYLRTQIGANFFLALAEADPDSALKCLETTVGRWSKKSLLEFSTGRREVIWALERIAVHRDLFPDAARLLLALGEAENETWSNNASGVFVQLFSPAPGRVAPTEASPQERFPVLVEAMESTSKKRRLLALDACNAALKTGHFTRMIGSEYQGLKKELQLWTPKTYGEIFDAYRRVWKLLYDRLDKMPEDDEQQKAIDILLAHARGLTLNPHLSDMVIDTVTELEQKPYVPKEKVIATVVRILHYESKEFSKETRQRWEQLRDTLTGNDFASLMKRYVGMDLFEDQFDRQGKRVDETQSRIEKLAKLAIENHILLKPELNWLTNTETQNSYRFGYELGKRDKGFSLLPELIEVQRLVERNVGVPFLGGYFRTLFESDEKEWERQLDALVDDPKMRRWVVELTWRSGLSDKAALRVCDLFANGSITSSHFQMFFGQIMSLSEDTFKMWVERLLGSDDTYATTVVLQLFYRYYVREKSKHAPPEELTLKVLVHQSLFQNIEPIKRNSMDDYYWAIIGRKFIQEYPERSLELAEKIIEHFGEEGTIADIYSRYIMDLLREITRRNPEGVWTVVTNYLGPPINSRSYTITRWLRGEDLFSTESIGILQLIPLDKIWMWVDEDVEKRARYLAGFVPNRLFREEGKPCLAREVLCRYGDREDVRSSLMANFSTEGWSGPASLHYQEKRKQLIEFRKGEDNDNVKRWIDEYVSSIDRQIERERIEEEREDF